MQFRLTYEGILLGASRKNTRAAHKHEIRRKFHQQLKQFWRVPQPNEMQRSRFIRDGGEYLEHSVEALSERFARLRHRFVPLATKRLNLQCALDILFLRRSHSGGLVQAGDLDNRMKTLFDALRLPQTEDELAGNLEPRPGEDPFYCLLEQALKQGKKRSR